MTEHDNDHPTEFETCDPEVRANGPESDGGDSGAASGPIDSTSAREGDLPLSDSLSASVNATAPLYILGPDLFEEVLAERWKSERGRRESRDTGALLLVGEDIPPLFRDQEARAHYVYKNVMGLVWPCAFPDHEKQRLNQRFTEGWLSGDLAFLAEVPFGYLDIYREATNGHVRVDR